MDQWSRWTYIQNDCQLIYHSSNMTNNCFFFCMWGFVLDTFTFSVWEKQTSSIHMAEGSLECTRDERRRRRRKKLDSILSFLFMMVDISPSYSLVKRFLRRQLVPTRLKEIEGSCFSSINFDFCMCIDPNSKFDLISMFDLRVFVNLITKMNRISLKLT